MSVSAHKQRLTVQGTMVRFQDAYKGGLHGAGGAWWVECLHIHTPLGLILSSIKLDNMVPA